MTIKYVYARQMSWRPEATNNQEDKMAVRSDQRPKSQDGGEMASNDLENEMVTRHNNRPRENAYATL